MANALPLEMMTVVTTVFKIIGKEEAMVDARSLRVCECAASCGELRTDSNTSTLLIVAASSSFLTHTDKQESAGVCLA